MKPTLAFAALVALVMVHGIPVEQKGVDILPKYSPLNKPKAVAADPERRSTMASYAGSRLPPQEDIVTGTNSSPPAGADHGASSEDTKPASAAQAAPTAEA
ncbi:hypothetical protein DFH08DRAFT_968920 [Mycena albidolilacea]|uniref:Uncharacterized protein n=1 Tax=Mycena albidolilacea TaxID=1033008 RepID=A0AAD6ZJF5_9AGAR|nr:hypothetical protein DFH08DRAFT_968920 [Mycena albidolilacea]